MGYGMHMDVAALEIERVEPETPEGLRSAVRFPLALPVHLMVSAKQYEAVTDNISANGVLLHLDELLAPGTVVEFLIEIPEGTIAPYETAGVHCTGRIVRSYREPWATYAAAVIDEYSFL
ncbi:MAG TPA: PilZ domain-containing protein [Silvibacterium sp.]|nr:PilZ domain-containing protein [Silvibacterium sp.]